MKKKDKQKRQHYTSEFKESAVDLAKSIGEKETAEKLGIKNIQTLSKWIQKADQNEENKELQDLEKLKAEVKKLKKELVKEKKVTAILRDATVFFCQDQLK